MIKINEIKKAEDIFSLFPEITIDGHALTEKNVIPFDIMYESYISTLLLYFQIYNKFNYEMKIVNHTKHRIPKYVVNYFDKFKKDLGKLTEINVRYNHHDIILTNKDINILNNNSCILLFNNYNKNNEFETITEYMQYFSLSTSYMKHFLLNKKSNNFPLDYFCNLINIRNKKIIQKFEKNKKYLKTLISKKIKYSSPCIIILCILDWYENIKRKNILDEYGNVLKFNLEDVPDNNLNYIDYIEKYFSPNSDGKYVSNLFFNTEYLSLKKYNKDKAIRDYEQEIYDQI